MAGPLSPFRSSVLATNDPNRLGHPFCQPSGVRSFEDLHRPLSEYPTHYRAEITVESEDVVSACRSACRCVAYDRRVEEPRYGASHLCQRLSLEVWTSILGALSRMAAMPPSCPSRACSLRWQRARARPRPGVRIWSTSFRIMVDANGADGAPTDHPSGHGPLVCNGAGTSRRRCDVRVEPHFNRSSKRGHVFARRHLTPDSLPPEGCGTWAAARPPQPQKSGPSCRFAAARTTPVFAVSLRFASVRGPLIRPPRRCPSGG